MSDGRAFAIIGGSMLTPGPDEPPVGAAALPPPTFGDPARLFRVKVVAYSVVVDGSTGRPRDPLLTFRVTAPRVILAEINTHRMLSRSSESSRAIPARLRISQVECDPYRPLKMAARGAGMQPGADLEDLPARIASAAWEHVRKEAVRAAGWMAQAGLAKEELNRVLEPWALCRTVITGTAWANFWAQRTHGAAFGAFRFLARAMYVAAARSDPRRLDYGDWHLPFIGEADRDGVDEYCRRLGGSAGGPPGVRPADQFRSWADYHLCRWSAARAARVSYGLLDGRPATPEADDQTWAKLVGMAGRDAEAAMTRPADLGVADVAAAGFDGYDPLHASPLEHQGTPFHPAAEAANPAARSNLNGWFQFRKAFRGENVRTFSPPGAAVAAWADEIPPEVFSDTDIY